MKVEGAVYTIYTIQYNIKDYFQRATRDTVKIDDSLTLYGMNKGI